MLAPMGATLVAALLAHASPLTELVKLSIIPPGTGRPHGVAPTSLRLLARMRAHGAANFRAEGLSLLYVQFRKSVIDREAPRA